MYQFQPLSTAKGGSLKSAGLRGALPSLTLLLMLFSLGHRSQNFSEIIRSSYYPLSNTGTKTVRAVLQLHGLVVARIGN